MRLGGYSDYLTDTTQYEDVMKEARAQVAAHVGGTHPDHVKVVRYQRQIVAGLNFKIELEHSGSTYYVHLFQGLPHTGLKISVNYVGTEKQ